MSLENNVETYELRPGINRPYNREEVTLAGFSYLEYIMGSGMFKGIPSKWYKN